MNTVSRERIAESILILVLKELEDRGVLDSEVYEQEFGCESFDEVRTQIVKVLT